MCVYQKFMRHIAAHSAFLYRNVIARIIHHFALAELYSDDGITQEVRNSCSYRKTRYQVFQDAFYTLMHRQEHTQNLVARFAISFLFMRLRKTLFFSSFSLSSWESKPTREISIFTTMRLVAVSRRLRWPVMHNAPAAGDDDACAERLYWEAYTFEKTSINATRRASPIDIATAHGVIFFFLFFFYTARAEAIDRR